MPTLGSLLILQQNGSAAIALPFPLDAFYFNSKFGSIAPTVILSPVVALSTPSNRTNAMPTNQPVSLPLSTRVARLHKCSARPEFSS